MVGIFAGLKWRLVTSRIRATSGATRAWMIVGWCLAALLLALIAVGLVALRTQPQWATVAVTTLFTAQLLSWTLAPLVAFGVDETVDPAKFALLPMSVNTLQRGLLTASLIGYLPIANAVVLLGAAVALSATWALLPLALVCCAVQLVLCVIFSRALSTAMSGLMSGRRGRDLGVMVGFGVIVAYMLLSLSLNNPNRAEGLGSGVNSLSGVLGWGPAGALAQLPSFVHDGSWLRVVVAAVTAVAGLALGWWWWAFALGRSLTTVPSTTAGSAPARTTEGHAVATTTWGTITLIASRDRLLAWRDPMRRVPWLLVAFFGVAWPLLVVRGHGAVFAVGLAALLAGTQAGNQYGMDGSGLWLHLVAFADRTRARGEALGHALFVIIPGAVIVLISGIAVAAIRDDWRLLPGAMGFCLAALLGAAAMACFLSAKLPYAVRQSRKSMFANSVPGQSGRTAGASLALLGGGLLIGAPAGVLALLSISNGPGWGWAALPVGLACGLAALLVLAGISARDYMERGPEILAVVSMGDRS